MAHRFVRPPSGFKRHRARGAGPFVTRIEYRHPSGEVLHWDSRQHRKGQHDPDLGPGAGSVAAAGVWWRPDRRGWWMAIIFSIGSFCFAAGGIESQWTSESARSVALLEAIGSVFFTVAAYMQYLEVVNAPPTLTGSAAPARSSRWRPASWEPQRIDWLATVVQLVGTVLFNASTFDALAHHLTATQVDVRVWIPDALGSLAFLVSSQLAYAETCHRWFCLRNRTLSWKIVAVNLGGSLAFGVSAVASLVVSSSGTLVSFKLSNAGTWIGGVLFLAGSLLLIPEAAAHAEGRTHQAAAVAAVAAVASS